MLPYRQVGWTVEIRQPLASLLLNTTARKPTPGDFWRINFSRVEYYVKGVSIQAYNFTWLLENNVGTNGAGLHYERVNNSCENWVWNGCATMCMYCPMTLLVHLLFESVFFIAPVQAGPG